jgi:hypothetical protein
MLGFFVSIVAQIQAAQPVTAECVTDTDLDGRVVTAQRLICPGDVPDASALQAVADEHMARISYPVRLPRNAYGRSQREVRFVLTSDSGWVLSSPSAVLFLEPAYPAQPARRGIEGRCDFTLTLSADGIARADETVCAGWRRGQPSRGGGFERSHYIDQSRWLIPLGRNTACATTSLQFALSTGSHDRSFLDVPVEGAPTCRETSIDNLVLRSGEVLCDVQTPGIPDDNRRPNALTAACYGVDAQIEATATAILDRISLELPELPDEQHYEVARVMRLVSADGVWQAAPGQLIIFSGLSFPESAIEAGAGHMMCALGLQPDSAGRVTGAPVACISDVDEAISAMEDAVRAAITRWRFAPVDLNYCLSEQVHIQSPSVRAGTNADQSDRLLDAASLPAVC